MAFNSRMSRMAWLVWVVVVVVQDPCVVDGEAKVPCFFIFGDSLADNGNNNLLLTLSKANFSPYGVDSPDGATGRFTNNRTTVDSIAELLGFRRYIPPFAAAIVAGDTTSGVNYASTSAGIRDETGKNLGDNISFNKQLQNHRITISGLTQKFGSAASSNYLNKCLYSVGLGSNDYLSNYFLPVSLTSTLFTPQQYSAALISQYSAQLRSLYGLGARKVILHGIGQIGCTPYAISRFGDKTSAAKFNDAVKLFNAELSSLVDQLNNDLSDANFTYINTYGVLSNLSAAGFKVMNKACCATDIGGACIRDGIPCQKRSEYVFYDEFHPTDALNRLVAIRSYTASNPSHVYPYDINRLVAL